MESFLSVFLLPYFVVYFFAAFVWLPYRTWKRTGLNPYALGTSDTAYDYIGVVFRATLITIVLVVFIYVFFSDLYAYVTPIVWLQHPILAIIGISLLVISCVWTLVAQAQMGDSWRIGIDTTHATPLVQNGVFRWSRNPIFLGMRVTLLGFFLVLPNAVTLAILLVGDILIQIQVRLEEEHLSRMHGERYRAYTQHTRRWAYTDTGIRPVSVYSCRLTQHCT